MLSIDDVKKIVLEQIQNKQSDELKVTPKDRITENTDVFVQLRMKKRYHRNIVGASILSLLLMYLLFIINWSLLTLNTTYIKVLSNDNCDNYLINRPSNFIYLQDASSLTNFTFYQLKVNISTTIEVDNISISDYRCACVSRDKEIYMLLQTHWSNTEVDLTTNNKVLNSCSPSNYTFAYQDDPTQRIFLGSVENCNVSLLTNYSISINGLFIDWVDISDRLNNLRNLVKDQFICVTDVRVPQIFIDVSYFNPFKYIGLIGPAFLILSVIIVVLFNAYRYRSYGHIFYNSLYKDYQDVQFVVRERTESNKTKKKLISTGNMILTSKFNVNIFESGDVISDD